jgi:hypothetical protein
MEAISTQPKKLAKKTRNYGLALQNRFVMSGVS